MRSSTENEFVEGENPDSISIGVDDFLADDCRRSSSVHHYLVVEGETSSPTFGDSVDGTNSCTEERCREPRRFLRSSSAGDESSNQVVAQHCRSHDWEADTDSDLDSTIWDKETDKRLCGEEESRRKNKRSYRRLRGKVMCHFNNLFTIIIYRSLAISTEASHAN